MAVNHFGFKLQRTAGDAQSPVAGDLIDIETPPSEEVIDRIEAFDEVLSVRVLEAA